MHTERAQCKRYAFGIVNVYVGCGGVGVMCVVSLVCMWCVGMYLMFTRCAVHLVSLVLCVVISCAALLGVHMI